MRKSRSTPEQILPALRQAGGTLRATSERPTHSSGHGAPA
jgi:lambda repressor-like predicted transcriptional regulator